MARTPGSNTIAYYPLNGNLNDESGNGYNLTVGSGTASYTTLGTGIKCANLDSYWYARNTSLTTTVNTISFWYARTQWLSTSNDWNQLLEMAGTDGGCWRIRTCTRVNNATPGLGWAITNSSGLHYYKADRDYTTITDLNRHHIVVTTNGSSTYLYIDGNQVVSWSGNLNPSRYFSIGSPQSTYRAFAKMSNVILENKLRTATEVKSYYNDTAWKYGLADKPTILYGSSPIKEIYYGTGVEAWDTQGPAPDGYHVPLQTEWQSVYDAGVSIAAWATNGGDAFRTKMKMPFAGNRTRSTSNVYGQGSYGHYWSSTAYSADRVYYLFFGSSYLNPQTGSDRADVFSVRCFRNSPLTPDASWTTIYSGSNGAGIYHNASEGVISISSDGATRYTLADKNLGATTVYNNGDSLSEANCGKYYQRGNNYGFPRTGTVTTSSKKVNASAYGPGNYYSSSTFITADASPYDWSSVQNDNLWGGVTQGVNLGAKKIKAVYRGSAKIRSTDPAAEILQAIQNSDTTKLDAITTDGSQLKLLVSSTKCTTAFIANNTLLQTYVSKMWNTVTTDTTNFSLVGNTYGDDSWTQMVTNAATANSITFFSGGYYSSSSNYGWMKHRDGTVAKIGQKGGAKPQKVTTSNVEGVSFVGATFGQCGSATSTTTSGDGYVAAATYKVL